MPLRWLPQCFVLCSTNPTFRSLRSLHAGLSTQAAAAGANVIDIHHRRSLWGVPLADTGLELVLEVRDEQHGHEVVTELTNAGYAINRVGGMEYVE